MAQSMVDVLDFQEAVRLAAAKTLAYRFAGAVVVKSLKVTFSGHTACVAYQWSDAQGQRWINGTSEGARHVDAVLNFPSLPTGGKLTRAEADAWTGYMIHEIGGHVLYTDSDAWMSAVKDGSAVRNILNGLEDPRIEGLAMGDGVFPGASRCLSRLMSRLVHKAWTGGTYNPRELRQLPFTLALFGRWRNNGLEIAHAQDIWDAMDATQQDWLAHVLDRLKGCADTWETLNLARDIVAGLREAVADTDTSEMGEVGSLDNQPTQPAPQPQNGEQGEGQEVQAGGDDWTQDLDENKPEPQDKPQAPRDNRPDPMSLPELDENPEDLDGEDLDGEDLDGEDLDGEENPDASPQDGTEGEDLDGDSPEEENPPQDGPDAPQDANGQGMDGEAGDEPNAPMGDTQADPAEADPVPDTLGDETGDGYGKGGDQSNPFNGDDLDGMVNPEPDLSDMRTEIRDRAQKSGDAWTFGGYTEVTRNSLGEDATAREARAKGKWFRDRSRDLKKGAAKLRQQFRQLLTAPEWVGSSRFETKGRLRGRDLTRAAIGDQNVFSRRWEADGINTAVTLMLDLSGSMKGENIRVASDLAVLMSDILDQANVPFEVVGFKSSCWAPEDAQGELGEAFVLGDDNAELKNKRGYYDYSTTFEVKKRHQVFRSDGEFCNLVVFKAMGEKLSYAANTYSSIAKAPAGGTSDYAGLMACITRMAKVPASKRVIFTLVDGAGDGPDAMRSAVRYAKSKGIDVIGLGIGHDVSDQYDLNVTVHSLDQLRTAGLGLLVKQLETYHKVRKADIMAHQ